MYANDAFADNSNAGNQTGIGYLARPRNQEPVDPKIEKGRLISESL